MVRGKKAVKKEFLSPVELQGLQEEKRDLEHTIRDIEDGVGSGRAPQVAVLQKEIRGIDAAIQERTPERITRASEKDALYKEEKQLEVEIGDGMPTQYEMSHPSKNPGAVRKHMEWCKRNQSRIERYVQIQRMLRPMEPKSIEVLRKEK